MRYRLKFETMLTVYDAVSDDFYNRSFKAGDMFNIVSHTSDDIVLTIGDLTVMTSKARAKFIFEPVENVVDVGVPERWGGVGE